MKLVWAGAVVAGLLAFGKAGAQVAPYAMFSAGHYSGLGVGNGTGPTQSGGMTSLGGTFGVYDDMVHAGPARIGPDARLVIENSANSTTYGNKIAAFLVGGRVDLAGMPLLPVNPYLQVEIGGVGTNNGTSTSKSTSFAYQVQFGGDFTIFPHLATRLEYGTGQLSGNPNHTLQTFGVGLVVRLF
jgi:hypothetical protein